tara:strand:+ start:13157 stop:13810 length:654 start_codon:yes stop_codon:yes gene_type:complete
MARQYCSKCSKPHLACICSYLSPQDNAIAVLVLQHPDEKNKAIGTAKIVELGLARSCVISAITISDAYIRNKLKECACSKPLLIYPSPLNERVSHYIHDFEKDHSIATHLKKRYDSIILLDGTWRNTRELLHCNPWLKALSTLQLVNAGESRYRIRQAQQAGALATVEAVSKVLVLLDQHFQSEKLLQPFEKMIEFQIKQMGVDVYQNNYLNNKKNV